MTDWYEDELVEADFKEFKSESLDVSNIEFVTMTNENSDQGTCKNLWHHCRRSILDIYAAFVIFWFHLVTFETFLVVAITIGATWAYFQLHGENGSSFGGELSWILVSFAVVSPIIMQIKQAFVRRESALNILGELKSIMMNILLANAVWNWDKGQGRSRLPENHAQKTHCLMSGLALDLRSLLKLPTFNRGRHNFTRKGRTESQEVFPRLESLNQRIVYTVKQLHRQIEVMKKAGLPANEASRANQYHWFLLARIERLLNFKVSTAGWSLANTLNTQTSFIERHKQPDRLLGYLY